MGCVQRGNGRSITMSENEPPPPYKVRRVGGETDSSRVFNVPGVVLAILLLTVAAFLALGLLPPQSLRSIEFAAAVAPPRFLAGPEANGGYLRWVSPLIGHMFVHAGFMHIAFNSIWLLAFGAPVARRLGAEEALKSFRAFAGAALFLTFYFLCGAAGALTYIFAHSLEFSLLVGASGGVSGLLGALVRFAFNRSTLFGPQHAKFSKLTEPSVLTWTFVIIALNTVVGLVGGPFTGGASVAWEAHIGGYLFGLLFYPTFEGFANAFGPRRE